KDVIKKYGKPRLTEVIYDDDTETADVEEDIPDYPVNLFLSESGYFKKITNQSLRMSSDQKLKEGDRIVAHIESNNKSDLLFFTDMQQVYKTKASAFDDTKASVLGDYVPAKRGFDQDENVKYMVNTTDYSGFMFFVFENGKVAKVPLKEYETKTNRKKLQKAYSGKSPLVAILYAADNCDLLVSSSAGKSLVFDTGLILPKSTRDTQGVQVMTLRGSAVITKAAVLSDEASAEKFRAKSIPAAGTATGNADVFPGQLEL
ncbi:MAG: topoisomerase IV, partial [Oscillospiraceae bacterium]|nr:topoisomerase IV [Oscillospiraceae bacterium]